MAAPFGVGVGDFVVVCQAAHKLYRRIRDSQSEHDVLKAEFRQLEDLLTNLRDLATRVKLSGPQFLQLIEHEKDSQVLINDVNKILDRRRSPEWKMPLSMQLKWSKGAVADLRSRLTSHVSMLTGSYMAISQGAVLDALDIVKLNMLVGKTKCPSAATLSESSVDEDDISSQEWSGIILDLQNLGITAYMVHTHKDLMLRYFENAVAHGELPFRDGSISLYSGPIGDYKDIVEQVNAWEDGCDFADALPSAEGNRERTSNTSWHDYNYVPTGSWYDTYIRKSKERGEGPPSPSQTAWEAVKEMNAGEPRMPSTRRQDFNSHIPDSHENWPTEQQIIESIKSNQRVKGIFNNNLQKRLYAETEKLQRTIAAKDEEISQLKESQGTATTNKEKDELRKKVEAAENDKREAVQRAVENESKKAKSAS